MANSKISALTSAATVAGTEVLPIVQSSATVKVSIANLTPGLGTITAAKGGTGQTSFAVGDLLYADTTTTLAKLADVATGNALISGGVSTAPSYGKIGLTTHVSGTLPVANGGTATTTAFTTGSVVFAAASGVYSQNNTRYFWDNTNFYLGIANNTPDQPITIDASSGFGIGLRQSIYRHLIDARGNTLDIRADTGGTSGDVRIFANGAVERLRIGATGDTTALTGNFIPSTAAKGVNFTANTPAAGMTSQLLNWYEEGTWTPVIADATSGGNLASVGTTAARYTRIGRTVFVQASLDNITTTGMTAINNVSIRGLPFASAAGLTATGTCVMNRVSYAFNGWRPQIDPSVSLVQFTEFSAINANYTTMTVANILASGTSDIYFSITYII